MTFQRLVRVCQHAAHAVLWGCAGVAPSDLAPPIHTSPALLLKSLRLPSSEPWGTRFAQHSWFDLRLEPGGTWRRIEIPTPISGVQIAEIGADEPFADERWGRPVRVRGGWVGDEAALLGRRVVAAAKAYAADHPPGSYRAWPGPNSNTLIDTLLREVEGLDGQLHHNAVGKDYGWRVGGTSSGAGVEFETPLLGLQLGLLEGVELHVAGLTLGVGISPLRIEIPFLPALEIATLPWSFSFR